MRYPQGTINYRVVNVNWPHLIKLTTLAVLLTGCAPHILTTPPQVREAFIHFKIVDELPAGVLIRVIVDSNPSIASWDMRARFLVAGTPAITELG